MSEAGELGEVFGCRTVLYPTCKYQRIVLIGLKGLFLTAFTAKHDPAVRNRRGAEFRMRQFDDLGHEAVVDLGNNAGDVAGLGSFPKQKRQQVADTLLCRDQVVEATLLFQVTRQG